MGYKQKLTFRLIFLASIFLVFSVSCTPVERHKWLTTFFDGVPPLPGAVDPNALPGDTAAGGLAPIKLSKHKPFKDRDCHICHGGREKRTFSSEVTLTYPVPQLCYECHVNYEQLGAYMHGPAVVGDCTFCHNPHSTSNASLLKKPVPELCYDCHDQRNIKKLDKHSEMSYRSCNRCHDGHVSSNKFLLKDSL